MRFIAAPFHDADQIHVESSKGEQAGGKRSGRSAAWPTGSDGIATAAADAVANDEIQIR
jgi:hypothetical protein